jgi:ribosomal protein L37AE/L43A
MKLLENYRVEDAKMNNVRFVNSCPKCETKGVLKGKRGLYLKLECSSCNYKWQTLFTALRGVLKI